MLGIADASRFAIRPKEACFNAVGNLNVSFGDPDCFVGHRQQNQQGSVFTSARKLADGARHAKLRLARLCVLCVHAILYGKFSRWDPVWCRFSRWSKL